MLIGRPRWDLQADYSTEPDKFHPWDHARHARHTAVPAFGGRLTLNAELLNLPRDLGEFVIVHELLHLLAPNHGKVFKSFMTAYLPDWTERARRLRGVSSI